MRDHRRNQELRGHLLAPAFLLLATLAVAVPAGVSQLPEPPADLVTDVSLQREVAEFRRRTDGGSCRLLSAVARTDGRSSGFVSVMLRFIEALDHVSRDAAGFMTWVENVITHDNLDALELVADGVAGWFAGSLDPLQCVDATPPTLKLAEPPCDA